MEEELKSINRNYDALFIDNENKKIEFSDRIRDAYNKRDWEKFVELSQVIPDAKIRINEENLYYLFGKYTLENTMEEREEIQTQISKNSLVKQINAVNDIGINLTLEDGTILALIKATQQIPLLKEDMAILSEIRYGVCHGASKHYVHAFKNSKLVTGYQSGLVDKFKYLHSWIEFEQKGVDWVFDYTLNAIINKNAYYKINGIEFINEITEEEIYDDKKKKFQENLKFKIGQEEYKFDDKTYLTCAQEIKKELKQKNPEIYKQICEEER